MQTTFPPKTTLLRQLVSATRTLAKVPFSISWRRAAIAAVAALALGVSGSAQAQVTFGTPTTISTDTDVFNGGSLLYAYAFGSGGTVGSTVATINGVTFLNAGTITGGALSNANLSITNFQGNFQNSGVPTGVSTGYGAALNNSIFIGGGGNNGLLTLSGLTLGKRYTVQLWANDSTAGNNGSQRSETLDGNGASVTLFSNSGTGGSGSAGQFVLGTFTAAGTTQTVNFTSSVGAAYLNMVAVEAVPEPSAYACVLGGVGALVAFRRLRKRTAV